jgi:RecJ-like exonuclease
MKAFYFYRLKPTTTKFRAVCPTCAARGQIVETCRNCGGSGEIRRSYNSYEVASHPVEIVKIDRDPKTGVLRYWENMSEFFYETVTPDLNKWVPPVPHGVHLLHSTLAEASAEADRINNYLEEAAKIRMIPKKTDWWEIVD